MNPDRRIDDLVHIIEHDRRIFFECLAETEAEASRLLAEKEAEANQRAEKEAEASRFSESLHSLAEILGSRMTGIPHGSDGELLMLREQLSGAGVSPDVVGSVIGAVHSVRSEVERLQSALIEYRESWSYRLGYALLHPWRKLRTVFRLVSSRI